ncbi:MAG: Threonylcarbamoyl-AMP synthase [Chlamydiales bacterium]|nr:Threonylcarbamoyl-AMP synthase [Chlamydiales bacterium]MCH9635213.1 Threonylcarbamoyl-AMP synthase [Chlamydiales bacterium]
MSWSQKLKSGQIVAFPTETVYGLGASLYHPEAIKKIFDIKGRPQDNPLIIHLASFDQVEEFAELDPRLEHLKSLWPGPLTVVLKAKMSVPTIVTAGLETVAIRIPNHPLALDLLRECGPLVAPSANLSGKPSPTRAEHVKQDFDLPVIDGGPCQEGLESTILMLGERATILRPGSISKEQLEKLLGEEVVYSTSKRALAPGMKYRHYAPKAPLKLFENIEELRKNIKKRGVYRIGIEACELYNFLRECDVDDVSEIGIALTAQMLSDAALMNRLKKSSS